MGILDTVSTGIFTTKKDAKQDGLPTLGPLIKIIAVVDKKRHPRLTQDSTPIQPTPNHNGR